jgi:phage/plasmid-like protein (TIGR03299 family)
MMFVGETPWHQLGTKLESPPTIAEAIEAAGLDWDVYLAPMQWTDKHGDRHDADTQAVIRQTDGRKLGEVGGRWTPLQNRDAFNWFDPFLASKAADIETAGSLHDGRRIFILAKIGEDVIHAKSDDRVARYILLANGHDGTLALRVGFTPVRVVCNNTLRAATHSGESKLLRLRHTKGIEDALKGVQDVMNLANQSFEATAEQYRALSRTHINATDLERYVQRVFKIKEEDAGATAVEEDVMEMFEDAPGAELDGTYGTVWGAYNAVTAYLSWKRGRNADTRLDSLWFGSAAKLSDRALAEAAKLAKASA